MTLARYLMIAVGSLALLGTNSLLSYHYGYATCYQELNQLNRNDIGNLLAPGDETMIIKDLEKQNVLLECQLLKAEQEVQRLTSQIANFD